MYASGGGFLCFSIGYGKRGALYAGEAAARYTWAAWTAEGGCPHMERIANGASSGDEKPPLLGFAQGRFSRKGREKWGNRPSDRRLAFLNVLLDAAHW
jgi:hypothetical protein